MSVEDIEAGSTNTTAEEVLESSRFVDFFPGFAVSTAKALFVVPLLVRTDAPDDVVLVVFDIDEATAKQVGVPAEPAGDRLVV